MDGVHDLEKLMVTKDLLGSEREAALGMENDFQQFFMLGKLADETREMQMKFSDLVESLIQQLKHKKCSPKQIVSALDAYLPDECHQASDLDEFFDYLLPHMSFFNYEIPQLIVQHVEGGLVKEVAMYEDLFKSYCKNRISGPHPIFFTNEAQNSVKFTEKLFVKLDTEWDEMPIEDLKRFQCKLSFILNIRQEKLQLQSIQKGCVLFTFLIHRSLLEMLTSNILTDDQVRDLHVSRVLSIHAGSDSIFENMELLLSRSCRKGDLDTVARLLEKQVDMNTQQTGWSALLYASFYGHFRIVKVLLEHGAFVDVKNEDGTTPLMGASQNGHINVVKILLVHHANVNERDLGGWTALMFATEFGYFNIVQFLIENQAALDIQNEEKVSALHLACHHGNDKTVQIMLEAGARVDIRDQVEDTPLIYACRAGNSDVIAMLINDGADTNAKNRSGLTPLMCAIESCSVQAVKYLLNGGANVHLVEPVSQWTALFFAAKVGSVEIVDVLLSYGANPNMKDKDGISPLEVARVHGREDVRLKLQAQSQPELYQSKNFEKIQKQVFATTRYIHQILQTSYQKSRDRI